MTDDQCELLCIDFDHAEELRKALPPARELIRAADQLRALGDVTRMRIARALHVGEELCVCDLAWIVGASQGLVSHHLRSLRLSELVESRRDGRLVMYRLSVVGDRLLAMTLSANIPVERP